MKAISKILFLSIIISLAVLSCVKKETEPVSDLQKLRNTNNKTVQMDSAQAINTITQQKIQEVLDLSTLYLSGNRNTEIDTAIYSQIEKYFQKPDSLTFKNLFKELESLKVKKAMVSNINVYKEINNNDTLNLAKFNVEYFDNKNKSMGVFEKNAQYTLVSKEIQFKKEFKFYFTNFYFSPKKDSTAVGVIK
ncbi:MULTISPECIES: hypothetical protein [Chryseobacterium]|uniref:Lipoprotein n=1 Tax=Chryseobacterium taihuense TaxID=1141221 RepID=A0A4U8WBS0_9FLAO|nr:MULTISPECIES: hypothetical protein [Chryseobacterium]QQV02919.1 hypothetical protein I6I61_00735 [Chryseobacterium sp. FDAARGOS 1104]VFB03801.1 Uncharacterised protein [Chryseobacterium taihuense]